jgi:hypothetical protein
MSLGRPKILSLFKGRLVVTERWRQIKASHYNIIFDLQCPQNMRYIWCWQSRGDPASFKTMLICTCSIMFIDFLDIQYSF